MPIGYRDRHGRRPRQPLNLPRPPRDADNPELLSYVDRLVTFMQEWARDLLERVEESRAVAHRRWDATSPAYSTTSATDMVIDNVPLRGGTLYGVHFAAQISSQGTVASNERWLVEIFYGQNLRRAGRVVDVDFKSRIFGDGWAWITPEADMVVPIGVAVTHISGTADILFNASSNIQRTLTVVAFGPRPPVQF